MRGANPTSERAVERPILAGIGLRAPHRAEILTSRPSVGFLEVHAENYMGGGPHVSALDALRETYPVSIHGVGLSLGSSGGIDPTHLRELATLVRRTEPFLVSEHLAWSMGGGVYLDDLLPLPYTEESLAIVAHNVEIVQEALGRAILIENLSSYLRFAHSDMSEPDFLTALCRRTGCGILCDVNNIHVSARNLGFGADAYLEALPTHAIGEIHLAGHRQRNVEGKTILLDDHGSAVSPPVWSLYRAALLHFGMTPTLVEWDTAIPPLAVLIEEARAADRIIETTLNVGTDAPAS